MYCRFMSLTEKLGIPCRYFWYTQKKLYIFCRVQIISVGIFLTHRKIMRKNQRAKIYRSPNIRRQAKTQKIRFSAKRKKKGPQLVRDPQFAAFALQARSRCSAALLVVASWFLHWFRSTPSLPNSRWIQAAAGCRSGTAMDCASALLSNHSRSRCSTVDVCACLDFKKFSKKCYSRHHIESCDTYMKH